MPRKTDEEIKKLREKEEADITQTQIDKGLTKRRLKDELEQEQAQARNKGISETSSDFPQLVEGAIKTPNQIKEERNALVTSILEERKDREQIPTQETQPAVQPAVTENALIEEEKVIDENEQYRTIKTSEGTFIENKLTGERTPLYSGGVTPLTAEDLTGVVSMFTGAGVVSFGGKTAYKKLLQKASKSALPQAEAKIVKQGMLRALSKKVVNKIGGVGTGILLGQATAVAGYYVGNLFIKRASAPDRQIQSIDSGLSQVRETISLPVQMSMAGAPMGECLEEIDYLRDQVYDAETKIQDLTIQSNELRTNPEFTAPVIARIHKLKGFLDLAERQIILSQVSGEDITADQLTNLMAIYEETFPE